MKLIFVLLAFTLASCVTRATVHVQKVIVTVSPSVEIKAIPLP